MTKQGAAPETAAFAVVSPRSAAGVKFFRIRDLEQFQHYKTRSPPWVKLHASQLEDYDFQQLPDAAKFHALALIYLASKLGNKIPNDPGWVSSRIGARDPVDFGPLIDIGFLDPIIPRESEQPRPPGPEQMELAEPEDANASGRAPSGDASKTLASCYQSASTETETEAETEAHTEPDTAPASAGRRCVCCGEEVFSKYSIPECLEFARHLKATGRLVGGRPVENPGGLARSFHRKGEADVEIAEFQRPRPARREFTNEACPVCFGSKYETVPGKGARACEACVDERGRPTGKKPKGG